ncbi:MAG: LysR family transcriptional regulator [Deferribacterales bacterium]|jgi:DNA-binding transcriptional LysR family regulator
MQLSIDLLRTFSVVVEEMNFTRASERLFKTQSAVSLQMKRLSDEIGKPLFMQNGKTLTLTSAGEKLMLHASCILRSHDEACLAMSETSLKGTVNFGLSDEYTPIVFTKILSGFAEKFPDISVNVVSKPSQELKQRIDEKLLDIAILAEYESSGHLLRYEPMIWMASRSYTYSGGEVPLAIYPDYCLVRKAGISQLTKAGIPFRIAYESESSRLLRSAVKSGMAVSPVLSRVFREGDYRQLGHKEGFPELPHVPITLHKSGNTQVIEYLYEHIKKVFKEL